MSPAQMPRQAQPLYQAGTAHVLEVTTPEGIPLEFRIATAGARAGGVIVDYGIILTSVFLLYLAMVFSGLFLVSSFMRVLTTIVAFLLMNFYFTFFEVRWQGATPGKRVSGTRVINRSGGPVTGEAILTRNFLRLVEVFVPLQMLFLYQTDTFADAPWYLTVPGIIWAFLLLFLPLFNKYRMRLGDIAAGTVVVQMPAAVLLEDQGQSRARGRKRPVAAHSFTREQLDVYGEYELQVLEELLRNQQQLNRRDTLMQVTEKICKKIGYRRQIARSQCESFLQSFYESLRAHRERRMLYGRRKQDKHAAEGTPDDEA